MVVGSYGYDHGRDCDPGDDRPTAGGAGATGRFAERSNYGVGVVMDLSGERSHDLVEDGFEMLENLDHRGARGAEDATGDGAGMLIQKPHALFTDEVPALDGCGLDAYGVGQLFLPADPDARATLRALVEGVAAREGFDVLAWRAVPFASARGRAH